MERPELRTFTRDPVAIVLENRGKYIAACLTICRAYFVAGRPNPAPKLGSFGGWSDCVRSALIWLACDDPMQSMEIAREEDPERTELSEMLTAWVDNVGLGYGARVKLAVVIALIEKIKEVDQDNPYLEKEKEPEHPELLTAVTAAAFAVTGRRQQKPDVHSLGQWLRTRKGRVVEGKRFAYKRNPKGGSEWWVEEADEMAVAQAEATAQAAAEAATAAPETTLSEAPSSKRATRF